MNNEYKSQEVVTSEEGKEFEKELSYYKNIKVEYNKLVSAHNDCITRCKALIAKYEEIKENKVQLEKERKMDDFR